MSLPFKAVVVGATFVTKTKAKLRISPVQTLSRCWWWCKVFRANPKLCLVRQPQPVYVWFMYDASYNVGSSGGGMQSYIFSCRQVGP